MSKLHCDRRVDWAVFLCLVLIVQRQLSGEEMRQWMDRESHGTVEAVLVDLLDEKIVRVKRADGRESELTLSRLSDDDRKYVSESAEKQKATPSDRPNAVPGLDISMPAPMILPNPAGTFVLCAQGFFRETELPGGTNRGRCVRLSVVDLARLQVVATRDYPYKQMRVAVSNKQIYLADNEDLRLDVLDPSDLTTTSSQKIEQAVPDLLVIPDQLLCSTDGTLRLSLPDLRPSEKWAFRGERRPGIAVARFHDGWLIDGVLYDRTLTQPRLLMALPHRSDFKFSLEPWGVVPNWSDRTWSRLTFATSYDYPVRVMALRENKESDEGAHRVKLVLQHVCDGEIAELPLGQVELARSNSTQYGTRNSDLSNDARHAQTEVGLAFSGKTVLAAVNSRLSVWDLSDHGLENLCGPFRFERKQSTFRAQYGETTVLNHEILGADSRVEFEFKTEFGSRVMSQSGSFALDFRGTIGKSKRDDSSYLMNRTSQDLRKLAPETLQRLNIAPEGMVFAERVWAKARGGGNPSRTASLEYYILSVVPTEITSPILARAEQRNQAHNANKREQAERLREERKRAEEARVSQQRRERATKLFSALAGLAATVLLPWLVAAPCWLACYAFPSKRRMLAILMCIIAVLPICVCLFLFAKFLNQVEFERWERTLASYMLPMTIFSIILFALMFLTAVPIYAHSKGHALVSGIGWALLGPIGLLAVALMSDRTAPKPPPPLGPPS